MLKFEGIAVGTTIKAYDFEPMKGRTDRYVIGKITGTRDRHSIKFYAIECKEDSAFSNDRGRVGLIVYVPMEMVDDFDERITPLDGPCAPKSALIKNLADKLGLPVVDISLSN